MGSLRELDDLDEECGTTITGVGCGLWIEDILECGCDFCRGEDSGDGPVGETVPALTGFGLSCRARRSSGKSDKASGSLRPTSLSGVTDLSRVGGQSRHLLLRYGDGPCLSVQVC